MIAAILVLTAFLILLSGCGRSGTEKKYNTDSHESTVVLCAGFSEYDWTRNILGDNPSGIILELLNTSGVDMHSYQPSVSDMVKIAGCDLLIYTGGISEFWIDKATESSGKDSVRTLSLMEYFLDNPGLFPMYEQEEHDHDHGHEHNHGHEHEHEDEDANLHGHSHEHEEEADEHIWLSLKMAPIFCEKIADTLSHLDPENEALYRQNLKEYCMELENLDDEFRQAVSASSGDVILFADRFPFTYMMQDYGIHAHAAFPGCSAETEASFETIIDLANDLITDGLTHVAIIKTSSTDLAETIIRASGKKNVKICTLDSLQSVTSADIDKGFSYIKAMKQNKEVISECLN